MSYLPTQPGKFPGSFPRAVHNHLDWSLPDHFVQLLQEDVDTAVDSLIPQTSIQSQIGAATSRAAQSSLAIKKKLLSVPFMSALLNRPTAATQNGAAAHFTTDSALVGLFFEFAPGIKAERLFQLLDLAWNKDPSSTLKIILHARSIHEGKGDKEGFFRAISWIWDYHPRGLLANLHMIVDPTCVRDRDSEKDEANAHKKDVTARVAAVLDDQGVVSLDNKDRLDDGSGPLPLYPSRPHGSFNDLVDLLILHLNGQLSTKYTGKFTALNEGLAPISQKATFKASRLAKKAAPGSKRNRAGFKANGKAAKISEKQGKIELWVQLAKCGSKTAKHQLLRERLMESLKHDTKFQALYLVILDLFAKSIESDLANLDLHLRSLSSAQPVTTRSIAASSSHIFNITYAAKWVPTPAHGADKQLFFATAMSAKLFPSKDVQDGRQYLQKSVLTRLRSVLRVPEVQMKAGAWTIDYTKVPSVCMNRNQANFLAHDPNGFLEYLQKVASGEVPISGASLMPHTILIDAMAVSQPTKTLLADLQWKALVTSIRSSSKFKLENAIAIADVSASMGNIANPSKSGAIYPIVPCIALSLLLGDLAAAPWNGCFVTFSSKPEIQPIDTSLPLSTRAKTMNQANWTMTTNLYKVFDLLLEVARQNSLCSTEMVKTLYIFSDMQFNSGIEGTFKGTEHQIAKQKFNQAGYELPNVVYWNFNQQEIIDNTTKPARASEHGVQMVSGFSGAIMKAFLRATQADMEDKAAVNGWTKIEEGLARMDIKERRKEKTSLETVMSVISQKCFEGVVVVD